MIVRALQLSQFNSARVELGRSIDRNDRATRIEIIRALERRGMFSLQRSAPQVAEHLRPKRQRAQAINKIDSSIVIVPVQSFG